MTKNSSAGYLDVEYVTLNETYDNNHIRIAFATSLDLTQIADRKFKLVYETSQGISINLAISSNDFGLSAGSQQKKGLNIMPGGKQTIDIAFSELDVPQIDFIPSKIITAYIVVKPSIPQQKESTLNGTLKIYSIEIGKVSLLASDIDANLSQVGFNYERSTNNIQLINKTNEAGELIILDAVGRIMLSEKFNAELNISTANLPVGFYQVRTLQSNKVKVYKFIKE